ncbi:hypothetical protein SESBI_43300 [Sesbania bispinosa]|nr:hypothetical protein SESBI_43300 [Sesbania bispinosa]
MILGNTPLQNWIGNSILSTFLFGSFESVNLLEEKVSATSSPARPHRFLSSPLPQALLERLKDYDQEEQFVLLEELPPEERDLLVKKIKSLDLSGIDRIIRCSLRSRPASQLFVDEEVQLWKQFRDKLETIMVDIKTVSGMNRLMQFLELYTDMEIFFTRIFSRDRPKGKEVVKYERLVDPQYLPPQSDVQKVLNGSANSFRIYNAYPRYFHVTGSGDVRPLEEDCTVSADLIIHHEQFEWWVFKDINSYNVSGFCGGLTGPMPIIYGQLNRMEVYLC